MASDSFFCVARHDAQVAGIDVKKGTRVELIPDGTARRSYTLIVDGHQPVDISADTALAHFRGA